MSRSVERRTARPDQLVSELSGRLCACGCGRQTSLIPRTNTARGYFKGEARLFCRGHRPTRFRLVVVKVRGRHRVEDRGFESPCWVWLGGKTRKGYGKVTRAGKTIVAHRHVYRSAVGPIPEGYEVHHRCEVKLCVNPAHLEALTPEAHMLIHGRTWRGAA